MRVSIDTTAETISIEGINYSFDLFRWFGHGALGQAVRVVAREDGVITLQEVKEPQT
jgi:hypothetical protein